MIVSIILALIVAGFLLWLVGFIPMDAKILMVLRGVVVFVLILWVLQVFGLLPTGTVPRRTW